MGAMSLDEESDSQRTWLQFGRPQWSLRGLLLLPLVVAAGVIEYRHGNILTAITASIVAVISLGLIAEALDIAIAFCHRQDLGFSERFTWVCEVILRLALAGLVPVYDLQSEVAKTIFFRHPARQCPRRRFC